MKKLREAIMRYRSTLTGEHVSEAHGSPSCASCAVPIKDGRLVWARASSVQVRHAPSCPHPAPFKNGYQELFPGDD